MVNIIKVLVLTLARAIHVTGFDGGADSARWCLDFLKAVMQHTPHHWPSHVLQCFPPILEEYYRCFFVILMNLLQELMH